MVEGNETRGRIDIAPLETRTQKGDEHLTRLSLLLTEVGEEVTAAIDHARQGQDSQLEAFLVELRAAAERWSERASKLLAERKENPPACRDIVEEQSMESFPASDPPSSY